MHEERGSRDLPPAIYYYRRPLTLRELTPAFAAAVAAGLAAFYVARLLLQRTPLVREPGISALDARGAITRRTRRGTAPTAPTARARSSAATDTRSAAGSLRG